MLFKFISPFCNFLFMVKFNYLISMFFSKMTVKFSSWFNWSQTSPEHLEAAETKLLSYLKKPYNGYFVDIGGGWGLDWNKIWTIEVNPTRLDQSFPQNEPKLSEKCELTLPLVLVHGLGAGVGIWAQNLDSLSSNRKIYAFDVLGFGRSSRPFFDYSDEVEWQLTESIERWRMSIGLDHKFILLGHSFGAYLALSYALQYPDKVAHLILADPWGIPSQQQAQQNRATGYYTLPLWVRGVGYFLSFFKPFFGLRMAGPWGLSLIKKIRPDLRKKFEPLLGQRDSELILNYLYHCNVQPNPSGEAAFKALSLPIGWAKYPMIHRLSDLHRDLNLTFVYGARSWVDREPAVQLKFILGENRVFLHIIQGAGHHVYADKAEEFNGIINSVCNSVDLRYARRRIPA